MSMINEKDLSYVPMRPVRDGRGLIMNDAERDAMQTPLEIVFQGMNSSFAIEERIRKVCASRGEWIWTAGALRKSGR